MLSKSITTYLLTPCLASTFQVNQELDSLILIYFLQMFLTDTSSCNRPKLSVSSLTSPHPDFLSYHIGFHLCRLASFRLRSSQQTSAHFSRSLTWTLLILRTTVRSGMRPWCQSCWRGSSPGSCLTTCQLTSYCQIEKKNAFKFKTIKISDNQLNFGDILHEQIKILSKCSSLING